MTYKEYLKEKENEQLKAKEDFLKAFERLQNAGVKVIYTHRYFGTTVLYNVEDFWFDPLDIPSKVCYN